MKIIPSIIERYVGKYVVTWILYTTVFFCILSWLIKFMEQLNHIGTGTYTIGMAMLAVTMRIPHNVYVFFPLSALMGTVVSRLYGIKVDFLKDREAFDFWYAQMSSYRKEKIDRIKVENGKLLSLGAGILLEQGLKEYGIKEAKISLGENKKPYIDVKGADSLYFNLSHSGSIIINTFSFFGGTIC